MLLYLATIPWRNRKLSWVEVPLLLFLLSILTSAIGSKHAMLSIRSFFLALSLFGAYELAIRSKSDSEVWNFLMVSSYIISLYAIMQHLGYDFVKWETNWGGRPGSTLGNPNFFAGYIVVLAPLAVYNSLKNKLWIPLVFLLLICLYLTKTRGAWLASLASFCVLFFLILFLKGRKYVLPFLTFLLAFGYLAVFPYIRSRFDLGDRSVVERIFKWYTALEMIKHRPIFGIGAGNMKVNFALYQADVRKNYKIRLKGTSESNVHNEHLQIFAEQGVFGILTFLGLFLLPVYLSIRKLRFQKEPIRTISYVSSIFGFLFFCLTNFPLRIVPTSTLAFFVLGLIRRETC